MAYVALLNIFLIEACRFQGQGFHYLSACFNLQILSPKSSEDTL